MFLTIHHCLQHFCRRSRAEMTCFFLFENALVVIVIVNSDFLLSTCRKLFPPFQFWRPLLCSERKTVILHLIFFHKTKLVEVTGLQIVMGRCSQFSVSHTWLTCCSSIKCHAIKSNSLYSQTSLSNSVWGSVNTSSCANWGTDSSSIWGDTQNSNIGFWDEAVKETVQLPPQSRKGNMQKNNKGNANLRYWEKPQPPKDKILYRKEVSNT